jgi:MerR family transcriptional regulator, light-induced transcriptional regulator
MTSPELSTAQLSSRTGLPAGTLRMWESRHGFPSPARLPGGHRRYSERDAEAVLEVLRLRQQGLSLPAAIDRARRHEQPGERSVFAGLRRRRPDLAATVVPKRQLVALSHAIEDEYLAHAGRGLVFGSFQRREFFHAAEARWRELARTARLAVAVADFPEIAEPQLAPAQVPLQVRHPMAREWALIVDAPGAHACLTGWEHPGGGNLPDHARRFEVIWSFEREIVRAASEVAAELLNELAPEIAARVPDSIADGSGSDGLRFGSALAHRMVEYVAELGQGREPAPPGGPEPAPPTGRDPSSEPDPGVGPARADSTR